VSVSVRYGPLMIRRAATLVAEAETLPFPERENYCQTGCGLSYDYLRKIGTVYKSPSARVLHNLGLELWVRNPLTGESERVETNLICDWNPKNPRLVET